MSKQTSSGAVDASEGLNQAEDTSNSQEDHNQQINREPVSFLLPQLPSAGPSPAFLPSDQAFVHASIIFQQLREEKPDTRQHLQYEKKTEAPLPECRGKAAQRQAYHLAFNTLKYQDLLEDVITDSCFHISQHISSDLLPLAMVMLYDFQDRRFLLRERPSEEGEEPLPEVRALQGSLHRWKTKLAASLARCRVKHDLQSVSCFLSDSVRAKHQRAKRLPLYAWVNALKISVEEMCEVLQSAGLSEGKNTTDLKESTFCRDPLCPDTLVFSHHLHDLLRSHSLTSSHVLNIQDRSLCVAVSVLRPLLFDNYDVLVVGSFSAVTVAHVAVVAAERPGRVLVCGADHTSLHVQEIKELLTQMNIKNVRVVSGAFYSLDDWDATLKHLKVIIVLPQCSTSALSDPVSTIHSEHGDWDLLPDLSTGSVSKKKIHTMAAQQAKLLAHALNFSKVQTVVYCTRSVYPEENEQLVKRVLDKTHTHPKLLPFSCGHVFIPLKKGGMQTSALLAFAENCNVNEGHISISGHESDGVGPLRIVTQQCAIWQRGVHDHDRHLVRLVVVNLPDPLTDEQVNGPIFPDDSQSGDAPESKFFRLEPSQSTNGCFIARLSRQADPTKVETVHEVLARAAAKGLLGGILPEQSKTGKRGKNRKNRADSGSSQRSSPSGEERKTGSKLVTRQDPVMASDGRERGEGAFNCSEEEEEHTDEEVTAEMKVEKSRGHKRKHKRAQKQAPKESKQPKSHKKKRKKSKPRRIPRLTLKLMSSAKPSKHLSPITAAAHKLIDNPGIQSPQADDFIAPASSGTRPSPAPPTAHAASKQVKRTNTQSANKDQTLKDPDKPAGPIKAGGDVVPPEIKAATQEVKATDFVLPPISCQSFLSVHSKSSSSQTSQTRGSNISASSSSVYLPGL